jgi:nucleoside-triphosphatase
MDPATDAQDDSNYAVIGGGTGRTMKHIFLTGERNVGKSTIISRITAELDFTPKGFNTLPGSRSADDEDYIYILPYGTRLDEKSGIPPVACRRWDADNTGPPFTAYPETFDTLGADILRNSGGAKLIIMDELGFMEKDAQVFQQEVLNRLDGDIPILGVIKPKNTPFLDSIRAHKNVSTIEVTVENREEAFTDGNRAVEALLSGSSSGGLRPGP